jgi:hypothetical protein
MHVQHHVCTGEQFIKVWVNFHYLLCTPALAWISLLM